MTAGPELTFHFHNHDSDPNKACAEGVGTCTRATSYYSYERGTSEKSRIVIAPFDAPIHTV
jgi:hypothetical protein